MKPRLQTSLGQHLVLTPQLRQALHLLQLPAVELEAEISAAVESNPLLDWAEESQGLPGEPATGEAGAAGEDPPAGDEREWDAGADAWADDAGLDYPSAGGAGGRGGEDDGGDPTTRMVQSETLRDHLSWQLHLSHLSPRDLRIGAVLVDAIEDDGYLRAPFSEIAAALQADAPDDDEILAVLRQIQRMDPVGVGARDLAECLWIQLDTLPEDTPGRALAITLATTLIDRLPRLGVRGVCEQLGCTTEEAETALALLRSLDPRPGSQVGELPSDSYVVPDAVIVRRNGVWQAMLAPHSMPRLTIHQAYERMIQTAAGEDAGYLKGRLQEARWLLKNLEARGETLLKVVRCLIRQQSGFLEFGASALRPLTLREVAAEIGMHESTVSRAVARKYVHTPRGTIALRDFFASGIDTEGGGEASSVAIQQMIRRLIESEDPRRPLSDARLAESLKASGVPVARRTVAKYREAMQIAASHERIRID
ncbi:RNA polymerase factor sigma-54 [Luteimonas wenzhouensis]|uniref:RNA polymerase sigma-54 factor n=1 Tax=Luteimonas wenzhouensis TaxID=2599615 RepID=A0A5C5TYY2_9GAMM|nr:RNA polymerase factor sigma-54 [Luteimonas wenzhouensis]NLW95642.1 RNA polymerase factor sigma-54 [Xanthomonadaceae bacterium]TWT18877.1 RNA polymerase factor sigma-54 [Luteimonas wenzhouensis]